MQQNLIRKTKQVLIIIYLLKKMILKKDAANLKSGVKDEIASIADVLLQLLLLMLLKIRYPTLLIYSKKSRL